MSEIDKAVAELVKKIATKAALDNTPFPEAIDGLKAITAYLVAEDKLKRGRTDDADESEDSFATYRENIDEAEESSNGGTATPIRSRRRGRQPS